MSRKEKLELGEDSLPVYVTALFIALAGLGFLAFALYYLIYLPVPTPIYPLKTRVLIMLGMEADREVEVVQTFGVVVSEEEVPVYFENNNESEVILMVSPEETYTVLQEEDGWYKIVLENDYAEGWINQQFLLIEQ